MQRTEFAQFLKRHLSPNWSRRQFLPKGVTLLRLCRLENHKRFRKRPKLTAIISDPLPMFFLLTREIQFGFFFRCRSPLQHVARRLVFYAAKSRAHSRLK